MPLPPLPTDNSELLLDVMRLVAFEWGYPSPHPSSRPLSSLALPRRPRLYRHHASAAAPAQARCPSSPYIVPPPPTVPYLAHRAPLPGRHHPSEPALHPQFGDIIDMVDGKSISGMEPEKVAALMAGDFGTYVTIKTKSGVLARVMRDISAGL